MIEYRPIETEEAMELLGLKKKDLAPKKGPARSLSDLQVREIRNRYWLLSASKSVLSREFKVSRYTIREVIDRTGAYEVR